ncbi:hypothetical protein [Candidatus Nitrosocosmicus hydrocola]|uniref:hypothetical protein n=1 Tax=Candidatus Nitrosocosmicus hydrocola TaxID=1826872 RepID=UPI0011E5CA8E|nr:hypothetical protein [Candidatus Nitrosocosmicus hydrocola]
MVYKSTKSTLSNTQSLPCCDGLYCSNLPVETISVMAGPYGKIDLQLCEKCILNFNLKETGNKYENQSKGVSKSDVLFN